MMCSHPEQSDCHAESALRMRILNILDPSSLVPSFSLPPCPSSWFSKVYWFIGIYKHIKDIKQFQKLLEITKAFATKKQLLHSCCYKSSVCLSWLNYCLKRSCRRQQQLVSLKPLPMPSWTSLLQCVPLKNSTFARVAPSPQPAATARRVWSANRLRLLWYWRASLNIPTLVQVSLANE